MGSVGVAIQSKIVPVKSLVFGLADIRKDYIDIDGYSNKKTLNGAIKDLARAADEFKNGEGDALRENIKDNELVMVKPDKTIGGAQYILEWEEVPQASQINEKTDEMEYKDANWYLHLRFIR